MIAAYALSKSVPYIYCLQLIKSPDIVYGKTTTSLTNHISLPAVTSVEHPVLAISLHWRIMCLSIY
jgi:hypothetical protein